MHVIKGGWVGQTFALAKCNDSGGKKSRIRRSKEERKALVESFIKKYQKLNNGSFPSLNLTHKEVGGSFYTVREIVREVIQENKVLGPAKLTPEQQNLDDFLEQNPIGSMSIEPKTELLSPNDSHSATHILPNHHLDTSEELVLNANAQCLEPEHQNLGEGLYVNGSSQAFEKNEEHDRAMCVVSTDTEFLKLEGTVEDPEASKAKITHVAADLMVETFPLTSGSGRTYGLDENSCEASVPNANSEENEGDVEEMEAGNKNSVVDGMNFLESAADLRNERTDATLAGQQLEKSCDLGNEQPVGKVEVPLEENPKDSMTKSGTVVDTSDDIDCEVKDASSAEIMVTGHPHGIHAQSTDDTKSSSSEQSIPTKALASESNPGLQLDDGSKESNPTLDRMNLESWKTTSDQPHKMETNPILAFFKSFLAAFIKFWSE